MILAKRVFRLILVFHEFLQPLVPSHVCARTPARQGYNNVIEHEPTREHPTSLLSCSLRSEGSTR